MAMNPQNVLSSLRMMSDQQLQQYAAMHKNDPFVFPLAFQESQTRKQMRAEQQAAQTAPQEKVADQALASMAPMPEDVGIGQLPAQNLEGMAAGGIVAFDEGGEVPRYQNQGLVQMPPSAGTQFGIPGMVSGAPILPQAGYKDPSEMTLWEKIQAYRQGRQAEREAYKRGQKAPATAAYTPTTVDPFGYDQVAFPMPAAGQTKAPSAAPADQGGKTPLPPAPPKAPQAPQVAMPQMPETRAPSIEDAKKLSGQFIDQKGIMKAVDEYTRMNEEGIAALEKARKEGKPEGKAYEEYERMIKSRADELASDKETAKGEALLTAGLAVLGGSSPYALQNLSLATKGVEQYRDAMKDIKKAARENEKALADIEQARRAEGREDWKEEQKFRESAFGHRLKGKEMAVTAFKDLGVKDGEIASRLYDTATQTNAALQRTMIQESGATARTNAQIAAQIAAYNAPGQQERLFSTLGGGDVAKGLGVYAKVMGPEARGEEANRARAFHDWSTSYLLQQQYKNFEDYYRLSGAQSAVRKVPELMSEPARQNRP